MKMPASELPCVWLRSTIELVVDDSEMPRPVAPSTGRPAPATSLASILRCEPPDTSIPWSRVSTILNPRMVTQLRELSWKPWSPPRTVTEAPPTVASTIGFAAVPERGTSTASV